MTRKREKQFPSFIKHIIRIKTKNKLKIRSHRA